MKAYLARKALLTYGDVTDELNLHRNLGVFMALWIYTSKEPPKSTLGTKDLDGETWTVIDNSKYETLVDSKEQKFKITFKKHGCGLTFGRNENGKPFIETF